MSRYLNPFMFAVIGLLAAAAFGFVYATGRISVSTLAFLGTLTLALGVVAATFLKKMTHPHVSTEQMLYKTDHPTQM